MSYVSHWSLPRRTGRVPPWVYATASTTERRCHVEIKHCVANTTATLRRVPRDELCGRRHRRASSRPSPLTATLLPRHVTRVHPAGRPDSGWSRTQGAGRGERVVSVAPRRACIVVTAVRRRRSRYNGENVNADGTVRISGAPRSSSGNCRRPPSLFARRSYSLAVT